MQQLTLISSIQYFFFYNSITSQPQMNPFSANRSLPPQIKYRNQYTFLKGSLKKKDSSLIQFSNFLRPVKLPKIKTEKSELSRKIERDIDEINALLLKKQQYRKNTLSENRNIRIMPMMMPQMPSMPFNIYLNTRQGNPLPPNIQPTNNTPFSPQQKSQHPKQNHNTQPIKPQPQEDNPQLQQEQLQQKRPKNIFQQPRKSKLNRFRICAYAVYFTIYAKYFSRRFTQNRRNWFNDRYRINEGEVIYEKSLNVLKMFHEIDLFKMIEDAKNKKRAQSAQLKTLKASNDKIILINFIDLLLQFTEELMTSQNFIEQNHEVFTVGVLNQNFLIPNLYTPEETALLHIHPAGYIQIGEEVEILVLMLKIVIKMLVFNYLLGLKISKKWNIKQEKTYNLDQSQLEYLWDIARKAGLFLTIVCEEMYESGIKTIPNINSNWETIHKKLEISAAKSLQELDSKKRQQNSTCQIIKYLGGYDIMKQVISKTPLFKSYKESLKPRLIDMLSKIYTCLKYEQQKVYEFVYDLTLAEEYVIFNGKKKQKGIMKERKKELKKSIKFEGDASKQNMAISVNGEKENKKKKKKNNVSEKRASNLQRISKGDIQNSSNALNDKQIKESKVDTNNLLKPPGSIQALNPAAASINNISMKWGLQESESEEQEQQVKRKMKYKHEQAFYDNKFDGHEKLQKLKKKMLLTQTKKVL